MLSIVSSVFDPSGFVSPFVLPTKAVLQDLCRRGLRKPEVLERMAFQSPLTGRVFHSPLC